MGAVTRTIELDDLTPEELAALFCDLDDDGQAAFLNRVGEIAAGWPGAGWCIQSLCIVQSPDLSDYGKRVIERLADHYATQHDWKPEGQS
jgi:hypothetical protein